MDDRQWLSLNQRLEGISVQSLAEERRVFLVRLSEQELASLIIYTRTMSLRNRSLETFLIDPQEESV